VKPRKVPLRRCVVTGERFDKKELIRVVRTTEGDFVVDATGKVNGRGAYVQKNKAVIAKAQKTKILDKTFGQSVPESIYEELNKHL
jgi:uncharacterized protein